jgi:hypothetical protein
MATIGETAARLATDAGVQVGDRVFLSKRGTPLGYMQGPGVLRGPVLTVVPDHDHRATMLTIAFQRVVQADAGVACVVAPGRIAADLARCAKGEAAHAAFIGD